MLSVGFPILDEAMDVAQSTPQWEHYHVDAIYLLPGLGMKKKAKSLWYTELDLY